ncbi:methionine aminopeptidase [Clostridia bacterium]|nr:methionine aminopeptidase [Clostridia bacterium]
MVLIKSAEEIEIMKKSCFIAALALKTAGDAIRPGVTTAYVNRVIDDCITSKGAVSSFLGYNGFPESACISINNEVIHGIPSATRIINGGDIVSVDVGAFFKGFHGDNAATFAVGEVDPSVCRLLEVTKESLELGICAATVGSRIGDISSAIQSHVEKHGFSVVKEYVGHGVGKNLHEDPAIPNYGEAGQGLELVSGMMLAIEPMVSLGKAYVKMLKDGWTVVTRDGSCSAHFEHTIWVTDSGPQILTVV